MPVSATGYLSSGILRDQGVALNDSPFMTPPTWHITMPSGGASTASHTEAERHSDPRAALSARMRRRCASTRPPQGDRPEARPGALSALIVLPGRAATIRLVPAAVGSFEQKDIIPTDYMQYWT